MKKRTDLLRLNSRSSVRPLSEQRQTGATVEDLLHGIWIFNSADYIPPGIWCSLGKCSIQSICFLSSAFFIHSAWSKMTSKSSSMLTWIFTRLSELNSMRPNILLLFLDDLSTYLISSSSQPHNVIHLNQYNYQTYHFQFLKRSKKWEQNDSKESVYWVHIAS